MNVGRTLRHPARSGAMNLDIRRALPDDDGPEFMVRLKATGRGMRVNPRARDRTGLGRTRAAVGGHRVTAHDGADPSRGPGTAGGRRVVPICADTRMTPHRVPAT
ncbi:hypothetical protein GCM10009859_16030 [Kocuria salsicia]